MSELIQQFKSNIDHVFLFHSKLRLATIAQHSPNFDLAQEEQLEHISLKFSAVADYFLYKYLEVSPAKSNLKLLEDYIAEKSLALYFLQP